MSSELPPLRPALNFDPELLLRAQAVRVVFFDVDIQGHNAGRMIMEVGERG